MTAYPIPPLWASTGYLTQGVVSISHADFEGWLLEICPVYERWGASFAEGLLPDGQWGHHYLMPLSKLIALALCIRLTPGWMKQHGPRAIYHPVVEVTGLSMFFVERADLQLALGMGGHHGTTHASPSTWHRTWAKDIEEMFSYYGKNQSRCDLIAQTGRAVYRRDWKARIESIENWKRHATLMTLHNKIDRMGLTLRQEATVNRFVSTKKPPHALPSRSLSVPEIVQALEDLIRKATANHDTWTPDFAKNLISYLHRGRGFTVRQHEVLLDKFKKYGCPVPPSLI